MSMYKPISKDIRKFCTSNIEREMYQLYWTNIHEAIQSLDNLSVKVDGLGTFVTSGNKIKGYLKKKYNIINSEDKAREFEKITILAERFKTIKLRQYEYNKLSKQNKSDMSGMEILDKE